MEKQSVIRRIHIFNTERYMNDNTRSLLVLNRNGLFLDGDDNNLKEKANMYDQSVDAFFPMIQEYLKLNGINDFSIHSENNHNRHLNVDINDYEKIKRLIFEFAFIACSDHASDEHRYSTENYGPLPKALKASQGLIKQRRLHAIYLPRYNDYCITTSHIVITDDELEDKYLLMKKI